MKTMNISFFKAHISGELRSVRQGEHLVILDRDIPIAEVIPYQPVEPVLTARPPRNAIVFRKLRIRVDRDPLEFLLEERKKR